MVHTYKSSIDIVFILSYEQRNFIAFGGWTIIHHMLSNVKWFYDGNEACTSIFASFISHYAHRSRYIVCALLWFDSGILYPHPEEAPKQMIWRMWVNLSYRSITKWSHHQSRLENNKKFVYSSLDPLYFQYAYHNPRSAYHTTKWRIIY